MTLVIYVYENFGAMNWLSAQTSREALSKKIVSLKNAVPSFLCLLLSIDLSGQLVARPDYRFIHINEKQGLNGTKPTAVFQDHLGFIWIGTWGGVYRFDGFSCKLFEHQPGDSTSLPSNFIAYHAFHEDENGDLWMATFDAGLARFDRRAECFQTFRKTPEGVGLEQLNGICSDGAAGLWLATKGNGLVHFSPQTTDFRVFRLKNAEAGLPPGADWLTDVCRTRDGQIWAGTIAGLANLSPDGKIRFHSPGNGRDGKLSEAYVVDVFEDRKGRLWVCTGNGLNLLIGPDTFRHFFPDKKPGSAANKTQRIFEDREGKFWLGTEGGLFRFDPEKSAFEPIRHDPLNPTSIQKGGIHGIFEDNRGNLWFAADGGLSMLDRRADRFRAVDFPDLAPLLPELNTLYNGPHLALAGERIWVASEKGLFHFRPGEEAHRFLQKNVGPEKANFTDLFTDRHDKLWAGTSEGGFFRIDPKSLLVEQVFQKETKARFSMKMPVGARNTAFAEDKSGCIWLGALGVLNRFDPQTGAFEQFYHEENHPGSITSSNINDLLEDRAGNLWVATMGGLNLLTASELTKPAKKNDALNFTRFRHDPFDPNSLSSDHVRVIFEDGQGHLWVGTDAGLNLRLSDGRWKRFFRKDGLPENHITGIAEDKAGQIWLTTPSQGMARLDPETGRIERLTKSDGLQTLRFPTEACLRLPDDRMLVAGIAGFNVIDPEKLDFRPDSTPLHFIELKLFNRLAVPGDASGLLTQALQQTREIDLSFEQNVVSIAFTALNFTAPEKQVFRYRLTPFHENWQQNGEKREVTFTSLNPGEYLLRVETSGNGYDWSGKTLVLRIHPPWYRTSVAYLFYLMAIGGLLFAARRFELRRHFDSSEARRLRELDSFKTRFYTNITHEFRTPLTVILGMTEQIRKQPVIWLEEGISMISRNGHGLLRLVNQMLALSKLEAGAMPVHAVREDVILFLRYLTESFHSTAESKAIGLEFRADSPGFFMDFDKEKMEAIIGNLLSNAMKFTPSGGKIELFVSTGAKKDWLKIQVSDTGNGIAAADLPRIFDRFFQAGNPSDEPCFSEGSGVGLSLAKELTKLLGGDIRVESEPGNGAVFTVLLPGLNGEIVSATSPALDKIEKPEPAKSDFPISFSPNSKSKLQLLLVEDNVDVSDYMATLLGKKFNLQFAADGVAGIEAAFKTIPDLIISDVMMPRKNGFELCRTLKNDPRTSHIPLILLTAKADRDSRLAGLEGGADEYLAKPFDEAELLLRVEKLIELRRLLQEKYAGPDQLSAISNAKPASLDDHFLKKMVDIIEAKMADETFDMPELCRAMHMSRSNLFRKIKALTGQSATGLIRSLRLKKAKELLETTEMNVTEVCFAVGLGSPNYFSRAFQAAFGHPPSETRKG